MGDSVFANGNSISYKSGDGKVIAGVCAGLADFLRVDVTLVRLAVVLLSLLGGGGVLAYLVAWLIIPEEGATQSIAERMLGRPGR